MIQTIITKNVYHNLFIVLIKAIIDLNQAFDIKNMVIEETMFTILYTSELDQL